MTTVLVTGATGITGSNVCQALISRGDTPRALVREGSRTAELKALGCEIAPGDIRDAAAVLRAAAGCDYIIHTAAIVPGGPPEPPETYQAINVQGTDNVLAAARAHGVKRTINFTTAIHKRDGSLVPRENLREPYAATKAAAFEHVQAAVAQGLDAIHISPGSVVGGGPTLGRVVEPPGYNTRMILAITGKLETFPLIWASPTLGDEMAQTILDSLERGRPGEVYWTAGKMIDAVSLLNIACEAAGVPHRVRANTEEELQSEAFLKQWGTAIARVSREELERRKQGTSVPPPQHAPTLERLAMKLSDPETAIWTAVKWLQQHAFV